jgi:dTDP-4-dehydrorhamnose reductase
MLGQAMVREIDLRGYQAVGLDRSALDVTDPVQVERAMNAFAPDVVMHCAAYTNVDRAEAEPELARRINGLGARLVAEQCQRFGALFVYPSTDYVFSGEGETPWKPMDETDPINAYGRSKRDGEIAALESGRSLVVRTSWLYGEGGGNFVDTICRLAAERETLSVVDDQIGRPTHARSLAVVLTDLVEAGAEGVFHASDGGEPISWYDLAREALAVRGITTPVLPVSTERFPRPARRPRFSVLDMTETERTLGWEPRHWRDALRKYLT